MKNIFFSIIFILLPFFLIAQATTIVPDAIGFPTSHLLGCNTSEKGKIYYEPSSNQIIYCLGLNTASTTNPYWQGTNTISYSGKIGINKNLPQYSLESGASSRMHSNTMFIDGNVGIRTESPTEKLFITDGWIKIKSQLKNVDYRITYGNIGQMLSFTRNPGNTALFIQNGGNVGIGNIPNSPKLNVNGDVSYTGNLTVQDNGILRNTTPDQLIMEYINTSILPNANIVSPNTCFLLGFSFPQSYAGSPLVAVAFGQKNAGNTNDGKFSITVENVTTGGGSLRLCNLGTTGVNVSNNTYSLVAISQAPSTK